MVSASYLSLAEIRLIKRMLLFRPRPTNQSILAYFTRPGRDLNHRIIAEIEGWRGAGLTPASEQEARAYMDKLSIGVVSSKTPITELVPADNAGLGLARAISVANILRANSALEAVTILPLSAAQLVLPGDKLTTGQAGNVESRRRIEIRIRRRDSAAPMRE